LPNEATLTFTRLQVEQVLGGKEEYLVARVFFDLTTDQETFNELSANVKQTLGARYADAPLEIGKPIGYSGPFNHEAFGIAANEYYRRIIRIYDPASEDPDNLEGELLIPRNVALESAGGVSFQTNPAFELTMEFVVDIPERPAAW
jgi:hypothetical protein